MKMQGTESCQIPLGDVILPGDLDLPDSFSCLVVFSHGSGSSRKSPRNRMVAETLRKRGFGTLLFDLLQEEEDRDPSLRFNIPLLAQRLVAVSRWIRRQAGMQHVSLAFFGASTGAASALIAATQVPGVCAVVSRGGRPDLAGESLDLVRVPVLLIVGGDDTHVLSLNEAALRQISGEKRLEVIPGATHLFEEEGAMEEVCRLAGAWITAHCGDAAASP